MNHVNINDSILYNENFDNININNLDFPNSYNYNNFSPISLNSIILDSNENFNSKNDFSIENLLNRDLLNLNYHSPDNNNFANFKFSEKSEKIINLKSEDISNDSTISTKEYIIIIQNR